MYKKSKQNWIKHLDFLIWDLIVLAISYNISCILRFGAQLPIFRRTMILQLCLVLLLIYFCVSLFNSTYKNILRRDRWQEMRSVIIQVTITFAVFTIYMYITQQAFLFSRLIYFVTAVISAVLIYIARIVWKRILRLHLLNNENLPHMLIVASRETAEACIRSIRKRRYNDFFISGVVIVNKDMKGETIEGFPVVCNFNEIRNYILSEVVDEVFLSMRDGKNQDRLIKYLLETGIAVHISLLSNTKDLPNKFIEKMGGHMVLTTTNSAASGWRLLIKRLMDIIGSLVGLAITGILFLFLAPQIRHQDPGPVFFTQERVGKNGRKFRIYKFRSMYMDAEERKKELMDKNEMDGPMFKIEDDPRILPGIGHKIRDWSLDEFPQFWNVLKGDMSLVGTRPPTVNEFKQYDPHHKMRLSFKPGLTGLWQVSGRSKITDFEEIVKLDNHYITNWSIGLDIKILFKTIGVVLHRDGSM